MAMSKYTKRPMSFSQYTMMRGTVDYSNAKQFNFFESGYSFLVILSRPKFIEMLADSNAVKSGKGDFLKNIDSNQVADLLNLFCYILENEFRGASGFDDLTSEALEFTDGINTIATLGKTVQQSNAEITMQYTERSGAALTSFIEFYLKGCKKSRTQAKTYHGLIAAGLMAGGFENEVFNLLYIVTDNTLLGLEKAYLLLNAWPNKAPTSIYESEKGTIEMKQIDVTWTCFVMDGEEVNMRALQMLAFINEDGAVANYHTALSDANTKGAGVQQGAYREVVPKLKGNGNVKIPIAHPDDDVYKYKVFDDMDVTDKNSEVVKTQTAIYKNNNETEMATRNTRFSFGNR